MTSWCELLDRFHVARPLGEVGSRVVSVDALRGFDMFWIIGGKKILQGLDEACGSPVTEWMASQLDHATWYGFTFYDVIMPLFMFLVGISMVYSVRRRLIVNPSRAVLWRHIAVRILWLWILGMMVQGKLLTYDIDQIKLYSNTLQAIAAGYLIASVIMMYLSVCYQVVVCAGLLLLTWGAFAWIPVPGFGTGSYTPDGNIAITIDRLLLGRFQDGTTYTWILSSLNFGVSTMLGVFTGYLLQSSATPFRKFLLMLGSGAALVVLGLAWSPWHDLVKHLWTGSFVLYAGGFCLLLLAMFYWVIDVLEYRRWSFPLVVVGSNAIAAYVSAHIFDYRVIAKVFVAGLEKYAGDWYSFLLALGGFAVLYGILYFLYRRKIIIRL
jgi:predicted acyltransferase